MGEEKKKVEAIAALERERERKKERRETRERAHDLTSSLISIEARHSHKSQRERERQRVFSCHQFYFFASSCVHLLPAIKRLFDIDSTLEVLEVLEVMTGSAEYRPEAIESPSLGIPVVEIENPVTTRSESASLLKKGSGSGSRGKSKSRSGRYSIADGEEVSDALLQMVEQGGLRSHATND